MPLPDPSGTYADFLIGMIFLKASLAADPETVDLVPRIESVLTKLRSTDQTLDQAIETELTHRAQRNYLNRKGDPQVQVFRSELAGVSGAQSDTLSEVFPKGIRFVIEPVGEEQVVRLEDLMRDIELAKLSPHLASHPRKDKILRVLEEGAATVAAYQQQLDQALDLWRRSVDSLELARRGEQNAKAEGYREGTSILGVLKGRFGSESIAQSFTLQEKKPRASKPALASDTVDPEATLPG